jgi:hypothetical protein
MIVVLGNTGASASERAFEASESANAATAFFALVAVVVLLLARTPPERSRGVLAVAQGVGAVTIACAAYATWFAITTHPHFPVTAPNVSFVAFVGLNGSYRASAVLSAMAALVMGGVTIFAARHARSRVHVVVQSISGAPSDHA